MFEKRSSSAAAADSSPKKRKKNKTKKKEKEKRKGQKTQATLGFAGVKTKDLTVDVKLLNKLHEGKRILLSAGSLYDEKFLIMRKMPYFYILRTYMPRGRRPRHC